MKFFVGGAVSLKNKGWGLPSGCVGTLLEGPDANGRWRVGFPSRVSMWWHTEELEVLSEVLESPRVTPEAVQNPAHYGGADNPYETIKVIEAWGLGFKLGNTVKYISRAGKKDKAKELEDLKKAKFYLDRRITQLEEVTK